jgi:hypothetical protein
MYYIVSAMSTLVLLPALSNLFVCSWLLTIFSTNAFNLSGSAFDLVVASVSSALATGAAGVGAAIGVVTVALGCATCGACSCALALSPSS